MRPNYQVGDIVQWAPDSKFSGSASNGPFVVTHMGDESTFVSFLDSGLPLEVQNTRGFYPWRFRKDEFLTAVKHAKIQSR